MYIHQLLETRLDDCSLVVTVRSELYFRDLLAPLSKARWAIDAPAPFVGDRVMPGSYVIPFPSLPPVIGGAKLPLTCALGTIAIVEGVFEIDTSRSFSEYALKEKIVHYWPATREILVNAASRDCTMFCYRIQ